MVKYNHTDEYIEMSKFALNYYKTKKIALEDLEKQYEETNSDYQPFHIRDLQCFNPIYNLFFKLNSGNFDSIALNNRYHIVDLKTIWDSRESAKKSRDIFIKFSPLLDPVKYLIGRYKSDQNIRVLPTLDSSEGSHKLSNPNNAAYIDNFFCYLSSQLLSHHGFLHGVSYYGSFLGIQEKFKMNLADDMDYLIQSDYFNQQKGKIYEIENREDPFANYGSRNNKDKLSIHNGSNVSNISLEELMPDLTECQENDVHQGENECIYEKSESGSIVSSENSSNNSKLNYSDSEGDSEENVSSETGSCESEEDDENEEEESDDESDEESEGDDSIESSEVPINGYIYDFPVQMICMEKCTGTLDKLFVKKELDMDSAASALFQVMMILAAYQKSYCFTHNDLHTNNIMYVETDRDFLYYKFGGNFYKVPTYGKIFKIIDFGRAIYRFQGKTFCSDSFAPGGDAATQYNCEPYFNEKKARLEPNYSFDLCRLGCSIYDFILDIEEETDPEFEPDELQMLIMNWVKDDNGKNVLYKKSGEERYPNFKLYKMIARTVHDKTPECQVKHAIFAGFLTKKKAKMVIDIDELPSYG